jgi:hypothetical protein
MEYYLKYFGNYTVFIPVFLFFFIVLLSIIFYCKKNGPNVILTTISFYIPMVASLLLGVLLYYTPYFWICLILCSILFIAINIVSFKAMEQSIDDKTGLGVTMFSGLVGIFIIVFSIIVRGIVTYFSTF